MQFKCTAKITYEFVVEADGSEEAEIAVFEALADDVTRGLIHMDIFKTCEDCFPVPMLKSVDAEPIFCAVERPADLPADTPFYSGVDFGAFDTCVFDGHMSEEDYEQMHKDRKAGEKNADDTDEPNSGRHTNDC
ncbi:MAG: hypothetical protein LBU77_00035 [Clostridiales bacterium]|jgi:hypothetical protein|nr:hypothetical protein [Clostridiales bacterium]